MTAVTNVLLPVVLLGIGGFVGLVVSAEIAARKRRRVREEARARVARRREVREAPARIKAVRGQLDPRDQAWWDAVQSGIDLWSEPPPVDLTKRDL